MNSSVLMTREYGLLFYMDLSPARSACWRSCSILANAGVDSRDRDLLDFFDEEVLVDRRDTDMTREDDEV